MIGSTGIYLIPGHAKGVEKTKVYLDTNMLLDLFVSQFQALRRLPESPPPKKFQFLVSQNGRFTYITSVLTKAEVTRELVSAHHATLSQVEELWDRLLQSLPCSYVSECLLDERLVTIVGRMSLRLRTLLNFVHVFIALQEGAWFVTGDKQVLEKIQTLGLPITALSYPDFRQRASGPDLGGG